MPNSNFLKIAFHPKITTKRFLTVKLPNMTDWHMVRRWMTYAFEYGIFNEMVQPFKPIIYKTFCLKPAK